MNIIKTFYPELYKLDHFGHISRFFQSVTVNVHTLKLVTACFDKITFNQERRGAIVTIPNDYRISVPGKGDFVNSARSLISKQVCIRVYGRAIQD